jgi:hypothetical protein
MSTTARLPAGYQWAATPEEAEKHLARRAVGLIHPGDHERARRWASVLSWYTPDGPDLALPALPSGGEQVVFSLGAESAPVGRAAAYALNRAHRHFADIGALAEVDAPGGGSVLLAAPSALCTFATLAPLEQQWRATGTRWGLLTGRDTAGMFFSLAKIIAARAAPSGGLDAVIDGPRSQVRLMIPGHSPSRLRMADAVAGDWRFLLIDAHGSGAHAYAAPFVLCGLSADVERTRDGAAVPGGCAPDHCKMAPPGTLRPLALRDLRAQAIALFVCNGITLGVGEQYPSDVSLALAAAEGHPAATLGLLRQDLDTEDLEPAAATRLLHAGWTLGHTAAFLADAADTRGTTSSYALLGDPDWAPVPVSLTHPVRLTAQRLEHLTGPAERPRRALLRIP